MKPTTFENEGVLWDPDVAKNPFFLSDFDVHPACLARVISENTDLLVLKSLDWVGSEFTPVFLWKCRERLVEVRVLFKGQTSCIFETAKVPQNLVQVRVSTERLWCSIQI